IPNPAVGCHISPPSHYDACRCAGLQIRTSRDLRCSYVGADELKIETDIGAGAVRLMNLDCDDISAVYQKARAYGYLKECGFVRPAYGDRCRRGRIDQSGRHIRSPDFVAVYIDDRSIVSQDSQSQVREDGCIGNAEEA